MTVHLRRLLALLALAIVVLPSSASAQRWQWARLGRGDDHDAASRVTVDSIGNSYVLGRFAGGISFGNTLLSGIGLWDVFLAKFNAAGALQWATSITGPGNDAPGDVAVDRAGNIYVSGSFTGNAILAGRSVQSAGGSDAFLAKLTPGGVVQWAMTGGGAGDDFGTGVGLDEPGAFVYISGIFHGTATFSGDVVTSAGGADIFAARYSTSQGGIQWVRGGGGPGDDASVGLGVDRFGSAFIAGTFSDSASFLAQRVVTPASDSGAVFIVKYDYAGIPRWASSTGVLPRSWGPVSLAVDGEGNTFIAGSFRDSVVIGTQKLYSAGRSDAFLARYNPFGGFRWAIREGDTLNDFGLGAGVDAAGDPYLVGARDNTGTITLDTMHRERMFVAHYLATGAQDWMNVSDGGRIERALDVGVDRLGNQIVGGQFIDTLALDGVRLVSTGGLSDAFVARLGPDATIATAPLADTIACAGSAFNLEYSIGGSFFTDNVFIAQLSDSSGSFAQPVTIGSRTAPTAGLIPVRLPATLRSGTGYRVRVVSTSPAVVGADNGSDLDIVALPHPSIDTGIDDTLCAGETVTLDAGEGYTAYRWSTGATTRQITVALTGNYFVDVTTPPGCDGRSDTASIRVFPIPDKPVIALNGSRLEVAPGFRHQWYRNGAALPGATRERFTPTESGSYTVTVYNEAGCSATSEAYEFVVSGVREEIGAAGIAIERSSSDEVVVSALGTGACRVEATLVDVAGRTLVARSAEGRVVLSLSTLPAGAYLLRVSGCDGEEIVRKLIR